MSNRALPVRAPKRPAAPGSVLTVDYDLSVMEMDDEITVMAVRVVPVDHSANILYSLSTSNTLVPTGEWLPCMDYSPYANLDPTYLGLAAISNVPYSGSFPLYVWFKDDLTGATVVTTSITKHEVEPVVYTFDYTISDPGLLDFILNTQDKVSTILGEVESNVYVDPYLYPEVALGTSATLPPEDGWVQSAQDGSSSRSKWKADLEPQHSEITEVFIWTRTPGDNTTATSYDESRTVWPKGLISVNWPTMNIMYQEKLGQAGKSFTFTTAPVRGTPGVGFNKTPTPPSSWISATKLSTNADRSIVFGTPDVVVQKANGVTSGAYYTTITGTNSHQYPAEFSPLASVTTQVFRDITWPTGSHAANSTVAAQDIKYVFSTTLGVDIGFSTSNTTPPTFWTPGAMPLSSSYPNGAYEPSGPKFYEAPQFFNYPSVPGTYYTWLRAGFTPAEYAISPNTFIVA